MRLEDFKVTMAICLGCTIIIELIVAFILGLRKKDLVYVILVNIMTNPLVTSISMYVFVIYGLKYKRISMLFLELIALLSEAYVYKKTLNFKKINPFIISLLLNMSSYIFGLIFNLFY